MRLVQRSFFDASLCKKAGRPSKFTSEVRRGIIKNINLGMSYEDAARSMGVTASTFYAWCKQGRTDGIGAYYSFYKDTLEARATSVAAQVKRVEIDDKWQVGAWVYDCHTD
jgi:transposase